MDRETSVRFEEALVKRLQNLIEEAEPDFAKDPMRLMSGIEIDILHFLDESVCEGVDLRFKDEPAFNSDTHTQYIRKVLASLLSDAFTIRLISKAITQVVAEDPEPTGINDSLMKLFNALKPRTP